MTLLPGRTPCRNCSRHWCDGKPEDYSEKDCTCMGNGMEKVDSVLFIFFCHYQHAPLIYGLSVESKKLYIV